MKSSKGSGSGGAEGGGVGGSRQYTGRERIWSTLGLQKVKCGLLVVINNSYSLMGWTFPTFSRLEFYESDAQSPPPSLIGTRTSH
jgi:hypothetical protein